MTTSGAILLAGAGVGGVLLLQYLLRRGIFGAVTENALRILRQKSNSRIGGADVTPENTPIPDVQASKEELPNESASSKAAQERGDRLKTKEPK